MDRFTKYVLLIMTTSVVSMIVATYIGVFIFEGDMETKYISIIEEYAKRAGVSFWHPIEFDEIGENIAFTLAGAITGLIVGYLTPSIFEKNKALRGELND